jgi:hypothetical protein
VGVHRVEGRCSRNVEQVGVHLLYVRRTGT